MGLIIGRRKPDVNTRCCGKEAEQHKWCPPPEQGGYDPAHQGPQGQAQAAGDAVDAQVTADALGRVADQGQARRVIEGTEKTQQRQTNRQVDQAGGQHQVDDRSRRSEKKYEENVPGTEPVGKPAGGKRAQAVEQVVYRTQ